MGEAPGRMVVGRAGRKTSGQMPITVCSGAEKVRRWTGSSHMLLLLEEEEEQWRRTARDRILEVARWIFDIHFAKCWHEKVTLTNSSGYRPTNASIQSFAILFCMSSAWRRRDGNAYLSSMVEIRPPAFVHGQKHMDRDSEGV